MEQATVCTLCTYGASVSEPHIDEYAVLYFFPCIVRTSCRKSLPALILRILTSCVNSKTIHNTELHRANTQWTTATAQTETTRGPSHKQSNQAVYLLACGDSKLDEDRWWT